MQRPVFAIPAFAAGLLPLIAPAAIAQTPVLAATPPARAIMAAATTCADLAKLDLTAIGGAGSRVTKAAETTSSGVATCTVDGTLAPSIGFRVELPVATWTQRFLQVGCGGLCGRVSVQAGAADGCPTLDAGGFVIASTDMGHGAKDPAWADDEQKRTDFAERGVHLTALASKALIARFYGQKAAYSYFSGCSDGGREALIEAQRFPDDFDGIIAGAPAMIFQVQNSLYHGWQARSNTDATGNAILLAPRLPILHAAVLNSCDALDGQKDGLVSAPALCRFDVHTVVCKTATTDTSACLTAAEVAVARRFYEGPRDPKTGERLTIGGPQYGSELAWAGVYVPRAAGQKTMSENIAMEALPSLIFAKPVAAGFTLADLTFDRPTFDRLRARHPLFDATNPDLSAFARHGGKLILYHGWADPHITPIGTIAYHEAVRRRMGERAAAAFERFYVLPGVYHCSGGEGPSAVDMLTPMMAWVEARSAPDAIVAHTADRSSGFGQVTGAPPAAAATAPSTAGTKRISRPLYPYPFVAQYRGSGDTADAASYTRGKPLAAVTIPAWAGTDFFQPYTAAQL